MAQLILAVLSDFQPIIIMRASIFVKIIGKLKRIRMYISRHIFNFICYVSPLYCRYIASSIQKKVNVQNSKWPLVSAFKISLVLLSFACCLVLVAGCINNNRIDVTVQPNDYIKYSRFGKQLKPKKCTAVNKET